MTAHPLTMAEAATREPALRRERHYGDRVVACFAERPGSLHALFAEALAADPEREALVHGAQRLSRAELDGEIARLAGGLAARGVGRGDRVAILLKNGVPFVALVFAIARLGAILVPLNVRDGTPGLAHCLADSGARVLVAEADLAAVVPPPEATPDLAHRIAVDGVADGFEPFADLADAPVATATPVGEDDPAAILYTSGTTGRPKGAMLTGLGIVHSATNYRDAMGLGPDDRTVVVVPMSHVTGLVAGIATAVRAGAAIVVERDFDAVRFLRLAADERMTFAVLVPAMYNLLFERARLADFDLSAWRIGAYGGAPMPDPTIRRLAEALPGLGLMNLYGATETTSPVTMMPASETRRRRLSVGLPVPGASILVMDDDGREVPPGETGELWHAGPMVVPGYWRDPEATAKEFVGGYWKSGDLGARDADGFVYVHDRKKDMINRGGYKIFTAEVESVLLSVPGVREAAVVARPCEILGERVHAVVAADPAAVDGATLAAACAEALADYQRPETFTIRDAPLPRNANGKILKRRIREDLGFAPTD